VLLLELVEFEDESIEVEFEHGGINVLFEAEESVLLLPMIVVEFEEAMQAGGSTAVELLSAELEFDIIPAALG